MAITDGVVMPINSDKDGSGNWAQYQKLVLHELQRLNKNIEQIGDNQKRIDKELEVVKVKSAFLGSMGGLGIVFFDTLVNYLKRM